MFQQNLEEQTLKLQQLLKESQESLNQEHQQKKQKILNDLIQNYEIITQAEIVTQSNKKKYQIDIQKNNFIQFSPFHKNEESFDDIKVSQEIQQSNHKKQEAVQNKQEFKESFKQTINETFQKQLQNDSQQQVQQQQFTKEQQHNIDQINDIRSQLQNEIEFVLKQIAQLYFDYQDDLFNRLNQLEQKILNNEIVEPLSQFDLNHAKKLINDARQLLMQGIDDKKEEILNKSPQFQQQIDKINMNTSFNDFYPQLDYKKQQNEISDSSQEIVNKSIEKLNKSFEDIYKSKEIKLQNQIQISQKKQNEIVSKLNASNTEQFFYTPSCQKLDQQTQMAIKQQQFLQKMINLENSLNQSHKQFKNDVNLYPDYNHILSNENYDQQQANQSVFNQQNNQYFDQFQNLSQQKFTQHNQQQFFNQNRQQNQTIMDSNQQQQLINQNRQQNQLMMDSNQQQQIISQNKQQNQKLLMTNNIDKNIINNNSYQQIQQIKLIVPQDMIQPYYSNTIIRQDDDFLQQYQDLRQYNQQINQKFIDEECQQFEQSKQIQQESTYKLMNGTPIFKRSPLNNDLPKNLLDDFNKQDDQPLTQVFKQQFRKKISIDNKSNLAQKFLEKNQESSNNSVKKVNQISSQDYLNQKSDKKRLGNNDDSQIQINIFQNSNNKKSHYYNEMHQTDNKINKRTKEQWRTEIKNN